VHAGAGVSFTMTGPDAIACLRLFEDRQGPRIDEALSRFGEVRWERRPPDLAQVAVERRDLPLPEPEVWPELKRWMAEALVTMYSLFKPMVATLDPADLESARE
jgi:hypothetical protein